MDRGSVGTIGATVVAAASVETAFHAIGVICMGAFGGALFALMKMPRTTLIDGVRAILTRFLPSLFCSWFLSEVLDYAMAGRFEFTTTALFLFVSFAVAAPGELFEELKPLTRIKDLWRGAKE